jgi:F0F1-type ATP synthase membrane subunit b/b'
MRIGRVFAFVSLLVASSPALAAGGHGFRPEYDGLYIGIFLILFGPLVWILAPKVKKAFADRRAVAGADLEDAAAVLAKAEERALAARDRIAAIESEMERVIVEFRQLGEAERQALAAEGDGLVRKVREETEFRIAQAVKVARTELAQATVARAFELAEQRLALTAREPISDALVNEVVRDLGAAPAGTVPGV